MPSMLTARVKVEVTPEMIEAARDQGIDANNIYGVADETIAQIYRAMRALEPGTHEQPKLPR